MAKRRKVHNSSIKAKVAIAAIRGRYPWRVLWPFALNLLANLIFTPIQFGLRSLPLAALDILVVWGTIVWSMKAVWPYSRWVAMVQLPYLSWVTVATVLQLSITFLNWSR